MEVQKSRSGMGVIGAGSGAVASLTMSALMLAAQKAGLTVTMLLAHVLFGAVLGALSPRSPGRAPQP